MNPFLYATLFFLICNIDGGDAERGKPSGRIKAGKKTTIDKFPWTVSLPIGPGSDARKILCGGSIIGSQWALTAAHCIDDKPKYIIVGKTEGNSFDLRNRYYIDRYYKHPNYRAVIVPEGDDEGELVSVRDDIAILKLKIKDRIPGSARLQPIPFSQTDVKKNKQCQMVGWGAIDRRRKRPSQLMKINVKIAENCDHEPVLVNPDDNICSQVTGNYACIGDSGGPLMCKENGRLVLKGVMSTAPECDEDTGDNTYVKVNKYVEWIEHVTKLDLGFRPVGQARMNQKIANAGSAMDYGGNATVMPNLPAISAEKLDKLPQADELNDLDGSYKLDGHTAQPKLHRSDIPENSKRTSGLDNHDGVPMSTNSASMSVVTSQIFMFVVVPICIIGLIGVLVVAIILIRKSSHQIKDTSKMTEHLTQPGTK